jgi:Zc3h12a-like ribonuclease protein
MNSLSTARSPIAALPAPTCLVHANDSAPPSRHKFTGSSHADPVNRCVIIDASNVIRVSGIPHPRLELLFHVLLEVALPARDFLVVGDANLTYELANYRRNYAEIYEQLCIRHPRHFVRCTGGSRSDPIVLAECAIADGVIVSNDRYRDWQSLFPWIGWRRDRFLRLNLVREALYIGDRRYPLRETIEALARRVSDVMHKRSSRKPATSVFSKNTVAAEPIQVLIS